MILEHWRQGTAHSMDLGALEPPALSDDGEAAQETAAGQMAARPWAGVAQSVKSQAS